VALKSLFLPELDATSGVDLRAAVRSGLLIVALAFVGGGAWLALAPLSGAIIAPGFVKVDLNRKVVQHQEGGIVKQVLVRDGDRVREGQALIVLDDVRVDAQVELLKKQVDSERVRAARLEAERAYPAAYRLPADLVKRGEEPTLAGVIEREAALYRARRKLVDDQIALLHRQIRETEEQAEALRAQVGAEDRALALQKDELALNRDLLKQNFVQKTRVMALERAVAEYESKREEQRAALALARQRITELELRISSLTSTFRQQAADELKDATARLFDLEERLRPSQDAARRQVIVAPVAGEVVNLQVFSAGAVVGPRDVLAEIVPRAEKLIIEARVRPEDNNYVHSGIAADVRLTAYKQRTTPLVPGVVSYVSGDRLVDPRGSVAYYVAHIEVPNNTAAAASGVNRLQAGMPAEVYIRTDERTALDYLVAPITEYLRRAMREPL
jgi:HlyD family type I secretion membrane fusion protein